MSGAVTYFRLPDGQELGFKQIRTVRLEQACNGCELDKAGQCEEGYYGLRLYKREDSPKGGNPYVMGVCIQRMDLASPTEDFYTSGYPESIMSLKEADYQQLLTEQSRVLHS